MNKYIIQTTVAILLVTATTFTEAQNIISNTPSSESRFTDIVQTDAGVRLSPSNNNGDGGIILSNVLAYNLTNNFSLGVGIGYEFNSVIYSSSSSGYMPLSADLRWYFSTGKVVTPFLNLNGGYGFGFGFDNGGEIFSGLNFGVRIITKNNLGVEFAAGLKYANYYYNYSFADFIGSPDTRQTVSNNFVFLPFTFGLQF